MAFPSTILSTTTELYLDGAWVDISGDVRTASPGGPITITRGRADEAAKVAPSRCNLTLNNTGGKYSPRNPNSPYYGVIGRNTKLRIRQTGVITDAFTRVTASGWGTTDTGQAWTVNGTASEYSTSGTQGVVTFNAVNSSRYTWVTGKHNDLDVVMSVGSNELATGASQETGITARYQTTGAHYWLRVFFNTDATVDLEILRTLSDGTAIIVGSAETTLTHVANTMFRIRFSVNGTTLRARAWLASATEPTTWDIDEINDDIGGAGKFGTRCRTTTGNTNGSMSFLFDNVNVDDIRFVGEVAQWPPRWDPSGSDVYVQIEANGILRRLQQGRKPLRSMLRRGLEAQAHVAYWPMEDDSTALSLASANQNATALVINETIEPGSSDFVGLDGSMPLPVISAGGTIRGAVSMPGATAWTVQIVVYVVYSNAANAELLTWQTPGGNPAWWSIRLETGSTITLRGSDNTRTVIAAFDNAVLFVAAADGSTAEGRWITITATAAQNGADIDYSIIWNFANEDSAQGLWWNDTGTLGPITRINSGPYGASLAGTAIGHLFITDDDSGGVFQRDDTAFMGVRSERAGVRILRLCAEEGIPCSVLGDPELTPEVGPQAIDTVYNLLQDAADVDGGILGDMRGEVGVAFRTLRSQLNQHVAPQIELDYDSAHLAPPFEPIEDDAYLRNDVTATRRGGSSYRDIVTTGRLSVSEPPDGVGTYDDGPTLNAYEDEQMPDLAGWRTNLGTWDEARYSTVRIDMARSVIASGSALSRNIASADLGDCMTVDNPPSWMPPDLIELIIQGYTERRAQFGWDFEYTTTPAGPYRAFLVEDDELGRIDTTGSTLATANLSAKADGVGTTTYITVSNAAAVGFAVGNTCRIYDSSGFLKQNTTVTITSMPSAFGFTNITFTPALNEATTGVFGGTGDTIRRVGQTSLSVATTTTADGLWTTDAADCPFDIEVDGERMTVTAISGGASPQTFTVTRGINGIAKAHSVGTAIRLWKPGKLAVIGDELVVMTAGKVPSAAELNALGETVQTIEKTADESLASSTTYQDDDELLFSSVAIGTYEIEGEIWYAGVSGAAQDIKIRWSWPAGSGGLFSWSGVGLSVDWSNAAGSRDVEVVGALRATTSPTAEGQFGTVTGSNRPVQVKGRMIVEAAGTLKLQWAQVTSSASNLTVKAGSWITLRKVA